MLIGIDASRANRKYKTGTEWYSYYIIRWLAKLDSKNEYILYTDQPLTGGLLDLTTAQYYEGDPVPRIEYDKDGFQKIKSPFNNFRVKVLRWPFKFFWTQGRLSLEMFCCAPNLLFVPSHTLPIIHPRKSVVTIHDVGFEVDKELYCDKSLKNKKGHVVLDFLVRIFTFGKYGANPLDYLHWSTNYILRKAKQIITISNFSKSEIIKYFGTKAEKIEVIPNGYNKSLYVKIEDSAAIQNVLDKYGLNFPYILYVGRIEKKKNIPNLIKAFSEVRHSNKNIKEKLLLVGNASFGYDETRYLIEQLEIDEEVIMPGWIEEKDMPFLYSGATAFVFPSNYEGFGIPLLQSMACELAITASNSSSIPEVAGEACSYFNPNDASDMAAKIEEIITDKAKREDLVEKGKVRVQNYSWQKTAEDILKLFG